jgi:hypothetical protein
VVHLHRFALVILLFLWLVVVVVEMVDKPKLSMVRQVLVELVDIIHHWQLVHKHTLLL